MQNAFLKRGYQQEHLTEALNKASNIERSNLLKYKPKPNQDNNNLLFITTFNKNLPNIREAINKHWDILKINDDLADIFDQQPKIVYKGKKPLRPNWSNHHQKL